MMSIVSGPLDTLNRPLAAQVPSTYRHAQRLVTPHLPILQPGLALKWYALHPAEMTLPVEAFAEARTFVRGLAAADEIVRGHGLGFVVFHYSTEHAYLLVATWYQTQELWLSLYVKELTGDGDYQRKYPGVNWSAACTWELAPIWHERQAWTSFLCSMRDDAAKRAYLFDSLSGLV